jgi:protein-S-isoprenylcysteine O-methyltransferase Ste14
MEREKIFDRKRHGDRQDLAGEHSFGDLGQIILLIIFLTVWIADSFFINYSNFLSEYVPLYIRIPLSIVILSISGYMAKAGLSIVFGEVREEPCVIKKGVFGIVRHPVYLGSILLSLGLLIFTLSIMSAVVWIVIIAFYYFISKHEEKLLLEKFGEEYEDYVKEVPMLIPRIKRG